MGGQTADGGDERSRITEAAGLVGGLTLISRVTGLLRDVVISAVFGTSMGADAFFVAFRIPNLFRRLVAEGAAAAAFVPVFTDSLVNGGPRTAARAASAVGGAAVIVLGLLVVAGICGADPLVTLFAPGFAGDSAKTELTISLTRLTFPYLLFVGAAAWAMGTLHTFRRFVAPALGPIFLNLTIVTCALVLASRLESPVYALVVGVLIGGLLQFAVQVPSLSKVGVRLAWMRELSHAAVARVRRLLGAVVFGGAVYQINILVATVFASLLPAGSVSYLWYADRVFEFPLGIVAVAVGTAALPSLSRQAKSGQMGQMAESLAHGLRLTWALCIPATVGLWLLAPAIIELLFERARFTAHDTEMTAWALRAYVPGLIAVGSVRILVAAFYALEKPRVPVYAALLALVVNIFFDVALMGPTDTSSPWWGAAVTANLWNWFGIVDLRHAGLALATGIAAAVNAVILMLLLHRKLPGLLSMPLWMSGGRHVAASALMAVAVVGCMRTLDMLAPGAGALVEVLTASGVGLVVYVLAARWLGSEEMVEIGGVIRRRRR